MLKYRNLIIILCSINLGILVYQVLPDYLTRQYLEKYATDALMVSNTYNWKNYTGKEGIQYFSPELQKKLFLNDIEDNVLYAKQKHIISKCYVKKIREIKIIDKNNASIYLLAAYNKSDLDMQAFYSTDMVLVMHKDNGKWLISNIIFKKGGTENGNLTY